MLCFFIFVRVIPWVPSTVAPLRVWLKTRVPEFRLPPILFQAEPGLGSTNEQDPAALFRRPSQPDLVTAFLGGGGLIGLILLNEPRLPKRLREVRPS